MYPPSIFHTPRPSSPCSISPLHDHDDVSEVSIAAFAGRPCPQLLQTLVLRPSPFNKHDNNALQLTLCGMLVPDNKMNMRCDMFAEY